MRKILKITSKVLLIILCIVLIIILAAWGTFIVANKSTDTNVAEYMNKTGADYYTGIKGTIYIPSEAYNAWQMYNDYSSEEIDRDMGMAESVGINAIRVFTSYEFWQDDPEGFFEKFEDLIAVCEKHGIRLLPVLFEDCGVDNTEENRTANDDETGFCVCSPERAVQKDKSRFSEVDEYVDEFMARYGNDERLLAIEIMNEPHILSGNIKFSKYVLERARAFEGEVPLTMGQLTIFHNLLFAGQLDIYQYHDNYPTSTGRLAAEMKLGNYFQEKTGRPFWLTEWQRVRNSGGGWGKADIPEEEKVPDLKSLSGVIDDYDVCSFFWSLMVKEAYLPTQRLNGTFNGLFYPDGTVYSEEDKQAIVDMG